MNRSVEYSVEYVAGVDHGTGGCKVTVLGSDGAVAATAYQDYPSLHPHPRWVEQDPETWYDAGLTALARALDQLGAQGAARVRALAFSAPHHVAVLLDASNRPVRPAIMWNDQRSGAQSDRLRASHGEYLRQVTGNDVAPTWTLAHLAWLAEQEPEALRSTRRIVFMKDYVRYRFSGVLATDHIEASGTMLSNLRTREWDPALTGLAGVGHVELPEIVTPSTVVGPIDPDLAYQLGLPTTVQIVTGTADTAAEVYGAGAVRTGDLVLKLATAGNVTMVSDQVPDQPGRIVYEHVVDGLYYLNHATNSAAESFRWFAATIGNGAVPYPELDRLAAPAGAGAGGLLFQPYLNGERAPHWDPYLRGSFLGLTSRHQLGHLARAVMEGVAYSMRDAGGVALGDGRTALIGGGAKSAVWGQIMADVFDRELVVPASGDASYGDCLLAATALGWYDSVADAADQCVTVNHTVTPVQGNVEAYAAQFEIYRDAYAAVADIMHRLSALES